MQFDADVVDGARLIPVAFPCCGMIPRVGIFRRTKDALKVEIHQASQAEAEQSTTEYEPKSEIVSLGEANTAGELMHGRSETICAGGMGVDHVEAF